MGSSRTLSTTVVRVCARCGSERLCKNGHANNGAQRAKCLECARTFILEPEGPRYDDAFGEQVVRAYQDRISTRGIQRTFGVCYQTLMAWVEKNLEDLPLLEGTLLPAEAGDVLELDGIWSFAQAKWKECWLLVAMCRRTRQIVAYTLGGRS